MSFADKIKAAVSHPKAKPAVARAELGRYDSTRHEVALRRDEVMDLGEEIKKRRSKCEHKNFKVERDGRERCLDCRDAFPCGGDKCTHLDCIEQGFALKLRGGFPRSFPYPLVTLGWRHTTPSEDCAACSVALEEHFEYMVDPSVKPEQWITGIRLEPKR